MKILGTGLNGLVGSRIVELLGSSYTFENISRSSGVDITNKEQVSYVIQNSDADVVLHLAAKTDVDGCEKDKEMGVEGEAWRINVTGTKYIADACRASNKKLIYISTDFVFDGEDTPEGGYTETDKPHPINWYAETKYQGEKIVQATTETSVIARLAYPYRANFTKLDFVRAIRARLENKQEVQGITDHIFTPTFIDDVAYALDSIITNSMSGIIHVVGSSSLTPFDAARMIAEHYNLDGSLVIPTTRAVFFENRAKRPFRLIIKNDKIQQVGVRMKTFEEGLGALEHQNT